ncbi:MAG: aminotransferase class I/II-fold pyridoxal phosphate-dependent enzyme, partial [Ignavibacteria bacterium]|nr:aminotransferase class I/II-fold pyridoxal phosphate-dependent enzyme [Ignavibacteria bacterium]
MRINNFHLERYFAKHEFSAKYLLSSSDCDGFEMKQVLAHASKDELKLWENLQLGYTESEGNSLLRESILRFYKSNDIKNVVVASPGELNFIAMNVLLEANDHVIVPFPSYQSLYEVVKSIGCNISFWKPNAENWLFETEDLENLIQENTKLIILNFPHNPTGSYIQAVQLNEIIHLARKHDITIFSDEMYHKLLVSNTNELPPITDLYEKGISLWGTSKSFGLAGLRIGWLVSQDEQFINKVLAFKDYLSICSSAPSEILSLIALNHFDAFLQPNIIKIKQNIELYGDFVKSHSIFGRFIP